MYKFNEITNNSLSINSPSFFKKIIFTPLIVLKTLTQNNAAFIGFGMIFIFVLIALLAPFIMPYSPYDINLSETLQPISSSHWFGTDEIGRDLLSRILYGTRITLLIVIIVSCLTTPIGLIIGIISGYIGGWLDMILMRITDIFLAIPKLILALALVVALGPGLENAIIAITLTSWTSYARLIRAETLRIKQADYITAIKIVSIKVEPSRTVAKLNPKIVIKGIRVFLKA